MPNRSGAIEGSMDSPLASDLTTSGTFLNNIPAMPRSPFVRPPFRQPVVTSPPPRTKSPADRSELTGSDAAGRNRGVVGQEEGESATMNSYQDSRNRVLGWMKNGQPLTPSEIIRRLSLTDMVQVCGPDSNTEVPI